MEERIALKRARQAALIPDEWRLRTFPTETGINALKVIRNCDLLSQKEKDITETTDANILLGKLASKELTSLEVTTAFAKRAALAHQLTNCCTEIFFDDAFRDARAADDYLAKTGKTLGPLHGLPVSVKDVFRVKGQDTTVGWVAMSGKPAADDGIVLQIIRKLGGVPYVKTNVPQSMMMSDSYNHLFGQCVNTLNTKFISGGSSGGESALLSALGSIVGIGTDVGGSIRIPASLCGIYGLSPTSGRHPHEQFSPRQDIVRSVAGPMACSLSSIEAYMGALMQVEPWTVDPILAPVPWRSTLSSPPKRLRVGYIIDDGLVKVQPPVARAVRHTVAALLEAGHEVFEWDVSKHPYSYDLWLRGILSDGGEGARKMCAQSGEPLIKGMLVGTEKDILTTSELHQLLFEKRNLETEYLKQWTDSGIDALIMPVTPWAGYLPKTWVSGPQYVGYTSIWNLLNYAALAVPATTVSVEEDRPDDDWLGHVPRNDLDEFNYRQYDVDLVKGLPVGIQVVGGRFGEEKCVAVGKVIDSLLKGKTT